MKKLCVFVFISIITASCQKETIYRVSLIKSDSIIIPIDKYVMEQSPSLLYRQDSEDLLYLTANHETGINELLVFDLNMKQLTKKVVFSDQNKKPFLIHGFHYINEDSIIIANIKIDTLFLSNADGSILKKYPYQYTNNSTDQDLFFLNPLPMHPFIYQDSTLYFSPRVAIENRDDFTNKSLAFSFNIKNNKIKNLNLSFPKGLSELNSTADLCYTYDGQNIIFSPRSSDEIWISTLQHGIFTPIKKITAKSDYFKKFLSETTEDVSMKTALYNVITNSSYHEIIYDKYRQVYYRIFYPGIDIENDSKLLSSKSRYFEKISIIILDKEFNKIGESLFTNSQLGFYSYFVTPKGLNIYSNIPGTTHYIPNHLKFTTLILNVKNL